MNKSSISITPSDVTVGSRAQIIYHYQLNSFFPHIVIDNPQNQEAPDINNSYSILSSHFEVNGTDGIVILDIIPWKSGELTFEQLIFKNGDTEFSIDLPPVLIKSVIEETGRTELSNEAPPVVIPGTTYAVYGMAIVILVFFIALLYIIIRIQKVQKFLGELSEQIGKSRNYRKLLKKFKYILKNKTLNDSAAATELVIAFKQYLEYRFLGKFTAYSTSEIQKNIERLFPQKENEKIVQNTVQVLKNCDYIRFADEADKPEFSSDAKNAAIQILKEAAALFEQEIPNASL